MTNMPTTEVITILQAEAWAAWEDADSNAISEHRTYRRSVAEALEVAIAALIHAERVARSGTL